MVTVSQLLRIKGNDIFATRPEATVLDALHLMAEKNVGALLVLDHGKLAGIFSERDYARKVILHGKTSKETLVREIMTTEVYSVSPGDTLDECMALMTEEHIRHLPVLSGGQVVGVISIGDIVKEIISEQGFVIGQLEKYIAGGR